MRQFPGHRSPRLLAFGPALVSNHREADENHERQATCLEIRHPPEIPYLGCVSEVDVLEVGVPHRRISLIETARIGPDLGLPLHSL